MENTEPSGIKELRGAKADYLAALSNLRAADAEKVKAEATLVQAKAATEQARAALKQAAAKAQEIANDKTAADNAIALEKAKKDAEVYLAQQEKVLAEAEEALRAYLVKVEEQSKQLTWTEQQIVWAYTQAYNNVVAKQANVRKADSLVYVATYGSKGENKVEAAKADAKLTIAVATADIERAQAKYEEYSKKSEEEIAKYDVWAEEVKKLEDSAYNYKYDLAEIEKAEALAKIEYKEAFDAFYGELKEAQEDVEDVVEAAKDFSMVYTRATKNAFELPNPKVSFFATFENAVNGITNEIGNNIKVKDGENDTKVLSVNFNDKKKAYNAIFGDEEDETKASLAGIIDALKRDSVVVDQLVKDTAGISAAVAKVKAEYESVKDTLVKGIAAYKAVVDSQAKKVLADTAKAQAERAYTAAKNNFEADTAAVFDAINSFVEVWNDIADDGQVLDKNDSTAVWTAFIDVMKARKKAFPYDENGKYNFFYFYKKTIKDYAEAVVKDSVDFANMDISGIKLDASGRCLYGLKDDGTFSGNILQRIISEAFEQIPSGGYIDDAITTETGKVKLSEIKVSELYSQNVTQYWVKLFFGKYYIDPTLKKLCIMTGPAAGRELNIDSDIPAVKTAYTAKSNAETAASTAETNIKIAKENYYKNIYCNFWDLNYNELVFKESKVEKGLKDSLVINYSEKTYTEPYVLPTFKAITGETTVYNKEDTTFNWSNVTYNENDSELKIVEDALKVKNHGKSNLKNERNELTLYARTLAAAQFEDYAKYYKENTKALAEIEEVVAGVELAYAAAVLEEVVNKAAADSAVTAYLGEDIVEEALAKINEGKEVKDYETASYLWTNKKGDYVVSIASENIDEFVDEETGKFKNLGGVQLAAAEEYIPDYAAFVGENYTARIEIDAAQKGCAALANIINDYAQAIAKLDKNFHWGDAETIDAFVRAKWEIFLGAIKEEIKTAEGRKATAEGTLAKLEAGYGADQVAIEKAEDALAKAQQALEQAEVEFAVAEAAYEAVLANHGVTE